MGSHGMRQRVEEIDAIQAAVTSIGSVIDREAARLVRSALRDAGWQLVPLLPAVDQPTCRCGHARHWHRNDTGPCEITGPQPDDGCDCAVYDQRSEDQRSSG